MYEYKAKVLRVVDGDTVDLEVDKGFNTFMRDRFRLFGIDAPETYGVKKTSEEYAAGQKAKNWLKEKIENRSVIVKTHKDKRGKYGRWLAEIFRVVEEEEESVNNQMIKLGLAQEYKL